jgi:hypothetical protein
MPPTRPRTIMAETAAVDVMATRTHPPAREMNPRRRAPAAEVVTIGADGS